MVSGYALVRNNAIVQDNALVTDHAIIEVSAQVQGNAVVEQYARMGDTAIIKDQAIARGDSYLWGTAVVSGYAIADYDYSMNYAVSDGNQFNHIPFDSYFNTYYAATQTKPRGLIASYDVTETSGEELWDTFGSLEAWLRGTPSLPTDSFFNNSQVLSLNGTSQYALLDRSLGNLTSGTYDMWVNPTSATADQTLLYFGSSANTYLKLTARRQRLCPSHNQRERRGAAAGRHDRHAAEHLDQFGRHVRQRNRHVLREWRGRRNRSNYIPADRCAGARYRPCLGSVLSGGAIRRAIISRANWKTSAFTMSR